LHEGRAGEALEMIERALKARPQPLARARLEQLKGRTLMNGPRPLEGYELLVTEARAVERADAALAARMLADAACAAIVGGDSSLSVLAIRRAKRLAAGDTVTQAAVAAAGLATTLLGAASKADLRLSPSEGGDDLESLQTLQRAASALMWRERHEEAARLLERLVDLGRAGRARVLLPTALDTLAAIDYRAGRWPRAAARSKEALRLARRMGLRFEGASSLTTTARLAAARGDEEEARTLLAEAIAFATDHRHVRTYAATAMGLLELGLGRIGAAIAALEPLRDDVGADPAVYQWHADLIEAYVLAGRLNDARELLALFERAADASAGSWARAAVARCAGLLSQAAEVDDHFHAALAAHMRSAMPFERARTELLYGERLRRERRASAARPHLRAALAAFERLGARPWAERARRELGQRSPRPESGADLTPHELHVAALVQRGMTNKEAAAALFVTAKTIEYHLASLYRKLGVRSRTELALIFERHGAQARSGNSRSSIRQA
jgi:DNA-binding NarL/FixJ family response regulator